MKKRAALAAACLSLSVGVLGQSALKGASLEDGGHTGTSALGDASAFGAGGANSGGEARMVGGAHGQQVCSEDSPERSILFLGNSYTHYYQMPQLFEGLAESAGCKVHVEYVAPGGSRLKRHAAPGDSLAKIGERSWDLVVLQNFSQLPSQPLDKVVSNTLPHVSTLVRAIRHNNPSTEILYYVTWGRRDGDKRYCASNPLVCTFAGHGEALHRGYSLYQQRLGGTLADVGSSFLQVKRDRRAPFTHRELYDGDGSHPSLKGSYLAASVFFATVFHASPEGLAYPGELSETSARYIQQVAGAAPITGA